jgi:hypothetical protein
MLLPQVQVVFFFPHELVLDPLPVIMGAYTTKSS